MADITYFEEGYIEDNYYVYTADAAASPTVFVTQTASADRIRTTTVTATTTATQTITVSRIRDVNATMSGAFAPTIQVNATFVGETVVGVVATMTTDASATFTSAALLDYFADLNAQADRTRSTSATFSSTANQSAQTSVTKSFSANPTVLTQITVDADVTRIAIANANVTANVQVDASVIYDNSSTLSANSTVSATIGKLKDFSAAFITAFTQTTYAISFTPREPIRPLVPNFHNLTYTSGGLAGTQRASTSNSQYLEYLDNVFIVEPDNTNEFFVEFFLESAATGATDLVKLRNFYDPQNPTPTFVRWRVGLNLNGAIQAGISVTETTIQQVTGSSQLPSGNNHVLFMWKPGSGIRLFLNGALADERLVDFESTFNNRKLGLYIGDDPRFAASGSALMDEVRIVKGPTAFADYGFNFNNTTQPVPTSQYVDAEGTRLLLHLNGNSDDDASNFTGISVTWYGEATLSSTANVTVNGGLLIETQAQFNVTATQTADGTVPTEAHSDMLAATAALIEPYRVRGFDATANVTATQTATARLLKSTDATLSAVSTVNAVSTRVFPLSSQLNVAANTSVLTTRLRSVIASATATSTLVAQVDSIIPTQAQFNVTATLAANVSRVFSVSAQSNATTSATAVTGVIKPLSAIFTINTTLVYKKTILLDELTYVIPAETRTHIIAKETRTHVILNEQRTHTIRG